jgi:GDP-mannose transporter
MNKWVVLVGYALASSSLAVINKWAIVRFAYPNAVLQMQIVFSASVAYLLGQFDVAYVDPLVLSKAIRFFPAVLLFYAALHANMKLLQNVNVDTFIVVRSCSPLLVYAVDSLRGTAALSAVSRPRGVQLARIGALVATSLSAAKYAGAESAELTVLGFTWSVVYLLSVCAAGVLVKGIVRRVPLSSWGLVLYNNALSTALLPLVVCSTLDRSEASFGLGRSAAGLLADFPAGALPVLASCIVGTAISWFGLQARLLLSPTSFMVAGVVNKGLAVFFNIYYWDRHSSPAGTMWLCTCIASALCYELL